MKVLIFGIPDCPLCKGARAKLEHFLKKWNCGERVKLIYYDMETVEGLAEAGYYEVSQVPTIVIEEDDRELIRWVKKPIYSYELEPYLRNSKRM